MSQAATQCLYHKTESINLSKLMREFRASIGVSLSLAEQSKKILNDVEATRLKRTTYENNTNRNLNDQTRSISRRITLQ